MKHLKLVITLHGLHVNFVMLKMYVTTMLCLRKIVELVNMLNCTLKEYGSVGLNIIHCQPMSKRKVVTFGK